MFMGKENGDKKVFMLYILTFFLFWSVYAIFFSTLIGENSQVWTAIIRHSIKILIWTIPVLLLLKYYYKTDPVAYLKLKTNTKDGLVWGITVGVFFIIYNVLRNHLLGIKFDFEIDTFSWIHRIILIGLTEEVVFRGFILQKLQETQKFWSANTISSILFVLIHFPKWFEEGMFSLDNFTNIAGAMVFVLGFGLIEGYVLKKSKSLWACMIIHSFNNFITIASRL
jgi:membrane protease YdiL (CAAX protease family)